MALVKTIIGANQVKTSDTTNSVYYYSPAPLFSNSFFIDNESKSLNTAEKDALINIRNLMEYINMIKDDDWMDVIKKKLNEILILSNNKFIAKYLVEHKILKIILQEVGNKLDLADIVFCTIINVCNTDPNIIYLMGGDIPFVELILQYTKYRDDPMLLNLMKILKLTVCCLQNNTNSRWLTHLQNYSMNIEMCIIAILQSEFNEMSVIIIIDLLWEMINCNTSTLIKNNLIHYVFVNVQTLILSLINSCKQITQLQIDKPINSQFIHKWLSIMVYMKTHLTTLFEQREEKYKYQFLNTLNCLLHLYKIQNSFSLSQLCDISQDIAIILKYIFLLAHIRNNFYIPIKMYHTLMQIMLKIKTVLDAEKYEKEEKFMQMFEFYKYLEEVWLKIKNLPSSIDKLTEPFDKEEKLYFSKYYLNFYYKESSFLYADKMTPECIMNSLTNAAMRFKVQL